MGHVSAGPHRPCRRVGPVAVSLLAVSLLAASLLSGCSTAPLDAAAPAPPSAPSSVPSSVPSPAPSSPAATAPTPSPALAAPATEASPPVAPPRGEAPARLTIPALGLDEDLIDLGISPDGSLEVPTDFSRVGWFTGGGRPGGIGPTVIAGHVDSAVGPAVFFDLPTLAPGDRFTLTDTTGTPFTYEVYRAEDFPKNAFPTADVFGALLTDEVRLITCTGLFDDSIGHYDDNRVVFAARVP